MPTFPSELNPIRDPRRILIADDPVVVRCGLRALLGVGGGALLSSSFDTREMP
jgi:hypothetical protein